MFKFMNFDREKNFWPRVGKGKILKSIKTTWSIWGLDLLKIIISNSLYLRLRVFSCRDFLWKEKTTFWEQKWSKTTKIVDTSMFLTIRHISKHSDQTIKSLRFFLSFRQPFRIDGLLFRPELGELAVTGVCTCAFVLCDQHLFFRQSSHFASTF